MGVFIKIVEDFFGFDYGYCGVKVSIVLFIV